jgi:hypothetical protein
MKTKTLLIAAVMFLGLSAAAFAQSVYSVSSAPITTVISTGNAELTGDITFTGTGTSTVGTITIQYGSGVNITSGWTSITVKKDGLAAAGLQVDTLASVYSPGSLVIDVPAGLTVTSGTTYAITVSGVRVQVSGTGLTSLQAYLSVTGGNTLAAGSSPVTVINSTSGLGIAASGVTSYNTGTVPFPITGTAASATGNPTINAVYGAFDVTTSQTNTSTQYTTIAIKEGFLSAWQKNVGVRISVSALPPKGVTFTFPATANTVDATATSTALTTLSPWVRGISTSTTAQGTTTTISYNSKSSALDVYYYVATDSGPTTMEALQIPVTITTDPTTETFPLAATTFNYTVTLAPVQGAYNTSGSNVGKPDGLLAPRFTESLVGPANLLAITGRNTALLIPYAYASTTAGDFNTAMAITNTTEDPGITVLGFTGATAQAGTVTFYLFPQGSSTLPAFKYTTAAGSPGSGLDSAGSLVSGGTYSVFLSQIFPLATPLSGTSTLGSSFTGYVVIVTNFSNTHGIFVISNFTNLTAQSGMMAVLSDRSVLPEKLIF